MKTPFQCYQIIVKKLTCILMVGKILRPTFATYSGMPEN